MSRTATFGGLGLVMLLALPGMATPHHRHGTPARPPAATPHGFYPNDVEGGVSGNLPFNNQIRKHSDPLNANGGK